MSNTTKNVGRRFNDDKSKFESKATFLNNFSIFNQILTIIALLSLLLVIQGLLNLRFLEKITKSSVEIYERTTKGALEGETFKNSLNEIRIQYAYGTSGQIDTQKIREQYKNLNEQLEVLNNVFPNDNNLITMKENIDKLKPFIRSDIYDPKITRKLDIRCQMILDNYNSFFGNCEKDGSKKLGENEKLSQQMKFLTILLMVLGISIATGLGFYTASSITNSFKNISKIAEELSAGDLTKKIQIEGSTEIVRMNDSFNRAIDGLRNLILKIIEEAKSLNYSSNELYIIADETGKASEEVAKAMDNMSFGTIEQSRVIKEMADRIKEGLMMNLRVSEDAQNLCTNINSLGRFINDGKKATNNVFDGLEQIASGSERISGSFQKFVSLHQKIRDIMVSIQNVHSQTTLLSLNASIEAARAGASGKGFAIIAEEMRVLSESSRKAAIEVENIIAKIIDSSVETNKLIEKEKQHLEIGKCLVTNSNDTFQRLLNEITILVTEMTKISSWSLNMKNSSDYTLNNLNKILDIVEHFSVNIEEVSASTQEQMAQTEHVSSSSHSLMKAAENLKNEVQRFKI